MSDIATRLPVRSKLGRAVLVAGALASAGLVPMLNGGSAGAQAAPADYTCTAADLPVGLPVRIDGTATPAPSPADVGASVALSGMSVNITVLDIGPFAARAAVTTPITGSAMLGPNGSANLGPGTVNSSGVLSYTGGSGAVTAEGTPGGVMDVTLKSVTIIETGFVDLVCTPTGAAAIIARVPLKATTAPTTAPAGAGAGGTATAAAARSARPHHTG